MIVRDAKYNDFEKVYPLLYKLNSETISKKDWSRIFVNNFNSVENFCGFVLEDEEKIVGFFGTIFCNRNIKGINYKFCNTTSWIVEEDYRAKSLLLLMKIHKLKDYIFTNFTPSETVYPILKKFGYQDINYKKYIIKPRPVFSSKINLLKSGFESLLTQNEQIIYKQHRSFKLGFFVITSKTDHCFVLYRKKPYFPSKLKKITADKFNFQLAEIEYISKPDLFSENVKEIIFKSALKLKIAAFVLYKKHLSKEISDSAKEYKTHRKFVYKGELPSSDIDLLFSEILILDL